MNFDMNIRKIPVDKLKPATYNPRKNLKPGDSAYEKIKRSLNDFGYVDPIIWNEVTGNICGGHQRYKVVVAEGATEIDCVVVHIENPNEEKALNIALNKAVGDWEPQALADLLTDLQLNGYDLNATAFDAAEIDDLFKDSLSEKLHDDNFDVENELQKPVFSLLGDVWILGQHKLVCGDSTKKETFDILMSGKTANLILTDPPYNVNYEGTAGKIKNDNMTNDIFYKFLFDAFFNMEKVLANDGSIYVFHADTEGLNFRRAFADAGFYLSGTCIWKKQSLVLGRSPYQWRHEPVLFGWKKKGKHLWYSDRKQSTIWEFDKPKKNMEHPTMKPISLLSYPIMNSSLTNCIVLDPFAGSFSTGIACEQTGRICYAIEIDPKFVDVCVVRYLENIKNTNIIQLVRNGRTYSFEEIKEIEGGDKWSQW